MVDGVPDPNTTRAMGSGSVNALQASSVVGNGSELDSEVTISRIPSRIDKTSGG